MKKWQSTLLMVVGGIGPAALTIVVLQQYGLIGPDTALLLGLLYLIFISTHVWCRIFTKIPPSYSQEQPVDSLPCYEEAVKSEPPPYHVLYPDETPPLCEETTVPSSSSSCPTAEEEANRAEVVTQQTSYSSSSSSSSSGGSSFLSRLTSVTAPSSLVTFHRKQTEGEDERLDRMPILGRSQEDPVAGCSSKRVVVAPAARGPRRHSCPASQASQSIPVSVSATFSTPTSASPPSTSSYSSASAVSTAGREERKKEDKFYKHFLENIGNPIDYV